MNFCKVLALLALGLGVLATPVLAQKPSAVAGDYTGMLGPMHVKLHLTAAANGTLTGTVDNPDPNLFGLPCADLHLDGRALSFSVPMTHGAPTTIEVTPKAPLHAGQYLVTSSYASFDFAVQ